MELTSVVRIAIVGCGSRGLTVLERLGAWAGQCGRRIEINVFDPQRPGPGLHSVEQPAYLMLNTVASQISMFPDKASVSGLSARSGPNFHEWCLRFKGAVRANEFLPRKWLGEYLAWTYDEVINSLAANVEVIYRQCAVDKIEHTDTGNFILSTDRYSPCQVGALLITIGHPHLPAFVESRQAPDEHQHGYPQAIVLEEISPGSVVGIEGLGLSAMDAVAGLTVGRGGQFVEGPKDLQYQASGREPRIFLFSRSALPYRTRPDIALERVSHPPAIFTMAAVAELRASYPRGLDFEAHVLPFIKAEMFAEYFGVVAAARGVSPQRIKSQVAEAFRLGMLEQRASALARLFEVPELDDQAFHPQALNVPVENYSGWMRDFIHNDLTESVRGLDHSPLKAALEVWRNCREQIRRIVDNHGLTPESHKVFFARYAPLVNRMVAGPQKERHQELLALADAGIVEWTHPQNLIHSSSDEGALLRTPDGVLTPLSPVIRAYVSQDNDAEPKIIKQLRESGIIHSVGEHCASIDVDAYGKAQPNVWITGPLVEGATYYNHYVPSPGSYCRAFVDADRIAREMLGLEVADRAANQLQSSS